MQYLPSCFKTLGAGPPHLWLPDWPTISVRSHGCQVYVLDCSAETLVFLWVIVLQTDLDFHSLQEIPFLFFGIVQYRVDAFVQRVTGHFRPERLNLQK